MKRLLLTGMLILGLSVGMSACQKHRESLTEPEGTVEASEMLQYSQCMSLSISGANKVSKYNMINENSYRYIGNAGLSTQGLIVKNISSRSYSYSCSVSFATKSFQKGIIAPGQTISCVGRQSIQFTACP